MIQKYLVQPNFSHDITKYRERSYRPYKLGLKFSLPRDKKHGNLVVGGRNTISEIITTIINECFRPKNQPVVQEYKNGIVKYTIRIGNRKFMLGMRELQSREEFEVFPVARISSIWR